MIKILKRRIQISIVNKFYRIIGSSNNLDPQIDMTIFKV